MKACLVAMRMCSCPRSFSTQDVISGKVQLKELAIKA